MEVLYPRCAGLDVHRDSVVACARIAQASGATHEVANFGTTTADLEALSTWLEDRQITNVAMEATGVYWKPVWTVLSQSFELLLANAAHVKNVPGRKTDVNDATWIADLLAHGLIRASFVPELSVQALRDLTRTRKQLVRERASHVQRIDKVLQAANIKLGSVISNIVGESGRAILDALAQGESDPEKLADRVHTKVHASRSKIVEAVRGRMLPHQRTLLRVHLAQVDAIAAAIAQVDEEVGERLEPFREAVERLITVPGISETSAAVIVSEIGFDMDRFPTAAHLISWAGLCPKNDESAGKRRSTSLRKSAPWLKTTMAQAAWSAARTKNTYFRAQFSRIKARRGPRKAIMAVASSMLTSIYWMLRRGTDYQDLGADHFDKRERQRYVTRLTRKLADLGFDVALTARMSATS